MLVIKNIFTQTTDLTFTVDDYSCSELGEGWSSRGCVVDDFVRNSINWFLTVASGVIEMMNVFTGIAWIWLLVTVLWVSVTSVNISLRVRVSFAWWRVDIFVRCGVVNWTLNPRVIESVDTATDCIVSMIFHFSRVWVVVSSWVVIFSIIVMVSVTLSWFSVSLFTKGKYFKTILFCICYVVVMSHCLPVISRLISLNHYGMWLTLAAQCWWSVDVSCAVVSIRSPQRWWWTMLTRVYVLNWTVAPGQSSTNMTVSGGWLLDSGDWSSKIIFLSWMMISVLWPPEAETGVVSSMVTLTTRQWAIVRALLSSGRSDWVTWGGEVSAASVLWVVTSASDYHHDNFLNSDLN